MPRMITPMQFQAFAIASDAARCCSDSDAFAIAPHAVQDVALAPMPASMDRKTVMTETPSPLGKMQYALALTVVPLQFFSITSPFCSFSAKT